MVGRSITIERGMDERGKKLQQKIKQRRLRTISLQGAIEKR